MNSTTAPIIQQQELTMKCDNNCRFCYNPERCQKEYKPREEDRKRNMVVAEISVRHGVMAVCPTGGEPLLVGNHLFEILDIYSQAGCYTTINSNGRLITPLIAKRLADSGLNSALISIHGLNGLHDEMVGIKNAFKETWNGIINLREGGIPVTPNFVATAKNIYGLLELGKALAEIKIGSMTVTPFLPSWGSASHEQFIMKQRHYKIYFESVKKIRELGVKVDSTLPIPPCVLIKLFPDEWIKYIDVLSPRVCMAGRSFGVVAPDGCFRACIQAPYLSDFGGNVLENYKKSWQNANSWAERKLLPVQCLECKAMDVCGGGCRTSCLWENEGSPAGKTMYMGEPLAEEQALLFRQKTWVFVEKDVSRYTWLSQIKVRDEGWGVIIFNPLNQSFTVLSKQVKDFTHFSKGVIKFSSDKTAKVLRAIGAIKPSGLSIDNAITIPDSVSVLPASVMLPRLAGSLDSKNTVYCLRADTGERYFF